MIKLDWLKRESLEIYLDGTDNIIIKGILEKVIETGYHRCKFRKTIPFKNNPTNNLKSFLTSDNVFILYTYENSDL